MHIETTAVVDNNHSLLLNDVSAKNRLRPGQKLKIVIDETEDLFLENQSLMSLIEKYKKPMGKNLDNLTREDYHR